MKLMRLNLAVLFFLGFVDVSDAQFVERLGKAAQRAAERTVERKVERKVEKETSDAMDIVLEGDAGNKKTKTQKQGTQKTSSSSNDNAGPENDYTVKTAKDFVRGSRIIFQETYQKVAIGDFPGTWNTNGSGEVVTIGNSDTRWLKVVKGLYMPEGIHSISENSTLEMDIHYSTPYNYSGNNLHIQLVALNDKNSEFTAWKGGYGKDGVEILIKPWDRRSGEVTAWNRIDNKTVLKTEAVRTQQFSIVKKTVHLSIWRQGNRMRVYLDDKKVFDLPRAFAGKNYNSLVIESDATDETPFYISNIVLAAEAGADTRHKLLETGSFTTSDILFETGKSTIQATSFPIIDEIGEALKANPSRRLTITGHTDSDGLEQDNRKLSEQRAESVKNYLVYKHNISSDQISTVGKGESEPVASGNSAEAKAKNRRVEFTLK